MPRLSIDYSGERARERMESSLPGDTLGYGWQLSGFSSIRRCLRQQVATATIDLDGNDTLCLDGEVSEYGNSEDSRQFTVCNKVRTAT